MQNPALKNPSVAPDTASTIPTELQLVLLCAHWPQTAAEREIIRLGTQRPLDWSFFLLLVQHHRLVPLVFANLSASVGSDAQGWPAGFVLLEQLRKLATANIYRTLRSLAELRRLVQQLAAKNVRARVLKGLPLAQTVFGDLSLRAAGDIDLLIDEGDLLSADRVLRESGYRGLFEMERLTPKRLAFYRRHWKDVAYHNSATGFDVDLHWRCFRNREMPGTSLCATPENNIISIGSFEVNTLPATETLLYLCVHGTLDGWLYLKSLVDVAAQVRAMTPGKLDEVAATAMEHRILPELSAALLLVRRNFGMESWSAELLGEDDATVSHILRFADYSLASQGFLANRDGIGTGKTMAFEIGLRRNFAYRFELLLRVLFRARMWKTIPLPDSLFGLYPLLSPFEWVIVRLQRRRKAEHR